MLALITRFLSLATLPKIWNVVKVSIQSTGFEEDGRNQLKQNLKLFRKLMVLIFIVVYLIQTMNSFYLKMVERKVNFNDIV